MSALAAELGGIALGDRRLNRRAQCLLERLGDKPTVSIPAACGGWSETRAAYRLFDHAQVTADAVLAPHIARTVERMREHPRVLCIQATSELDYTGKPSMQGLGPLNLETRQGLYLHPTLGPTPERPCLGLLDVHQWTREPGSLGQQKNANRPLEEKESGFEGGLPFFLLVRDLRIDHSMRPSQIQKTPRISIQTLHPLVTHLLGLSTNVGRAPHRIERESSPPIPSVIHSTESTTKPLAIDASVPSCTAMPSPGKDGSGPYSRKKRSPC